MTQKTLFLRLPRDKASPSLPRLFRGCVPSPSESALGPCVPRASPAFPGAAGRRLLSREATRVGGARRPQCGPPDGGAGFRLPAPEPAALLGVAQGPRKPPPQWVQRPRAVPNFLPRALGLWGADARPRAGPPWGAPYSPISPSSSSSSSCSISNKTSLVIICVAPQKAAPKLARSWGSRVPEPLGSRGPGAGRGPRGLSLARGSGAAAPGPRCGKPSRGCRRPAPSARGYHSPAERGRATEHAQCETRLRMIELPPIY